MLQSGMWRGWLGGLSFSNKDTWNNLGEAITIVFHEEEARPYGFVVCGRTDYIEQRLTNGTSHKSKAPIFNTEEQSVENNEFYFGLSWP